MKQIKNENVVKLENYIETTNNCYIVMEFCKDGDLDSYLKKKKILNEKEVIFHNPKDACLIAID